MNKTGHEFKISDPILQRAFEIAENVFEKAHDGERFHASDFYLRATTICPDLTFGLLGARFLTNDFFISLFQKQCDEIRDTQTQDGNLWRSFDRSMYQILYPIWVYLLYTYTGDMDFLASHRESVIKAFDYMFRRTDENGFCKIVGHGEWRYSEGADWVDWCAERMEGKTMVFQTWFFRSLLDTAYLFDVLGESVRADSYRKKAGSLKEAINRVYWRENRYLDNIDFNGKAVDQRWLDSQLWPVVFGIADEDRSMCILNHIENMGDYVEGVPVRWRESPDVGVGSIAPGWRDNGDCTWFGRLGSGAILARYAMRQNAHATKLLRRMSELFVRDSEIFECYDMKGNPMPKNIGGGNYLEHAGGYINVMKSGLFGIELPTRLNAPLIIRPRFSAERHVWPGTSAEIEASTSFQYLGKKIRYSFSCEKIGDGEFIRRVALAGSEHSVRMMFDFAHPLPMFITIREILVNNGQVEAAMDNFGVLTLVGELPIEVSVRYTEEQNAALRGLPPEQSLADSQ